MKQTKKNKPIDMIKFTALRAGLLLLAVTMPAAELRAQGNSSTNNPPPLAPGQMPYFDAVNDPIEGFNRCSWAVNDWLFRGVIYPLSLGYNTVAPKPVRTTIGNAGHNLT